MSSHLSRKDIKHDIRQDEVRTFLASAFIFVREKQRLLLGIAAAMVGVVLIAGVVLVLLQAREARAQESLTVALRTYSAAIDPVEPDPSHASAPSFATESERITAAQRAFQELVEAHGGTRAGAVARVYLGEIALESGDAGTARRLWGEFLDRSPEHALAASVLINLVQLDRRDGDYDGAISRLEAYLDEETSLPRDAVLYQLGRSLAGAGRDEEARETWERLVEEFPSSPYVSEAQRNLAV